jgi:hypothetical protein
MKRILLLILAVVIATSSYSQRKEERKLSDFEAVTVSNAINLYLKSGNETKAVVEADGIELDRVITEVSGGKLRISLRKNNNYRNIHVKVYVTYKSLEYISASSAADVYSESVIKSDKLEISASSAASIELDIDVNDLEMQVSSAGDIELSGSAGSIEGSASSAGDIDAFDMVCKRADVRASSAGGIRINVTDEIEARASSGGSVKYKGNPGRSNTDSSSGGSVRKY